MDVKSALILLINFLLLQNISGNQPCAPRKFTWDSVVCVCNETYCDTVEPNTKLPASQFAVYESSINGNRLNKSTGSFQPKALYNPVLLVLKNVTYQTVTGFGGAFTDAAGINILSLSPKAQENLLQSYYHPDGIQYTLGRIPMASCDFSTRPYSYDDTAMDFNLTKFSLAPEDFKYKIPVIQKALAMNSRKMSIFGSPWSAPAWMKTNKNMTGDGRLVGQPGGQYYKAWAQYFVRFLQEYAKNNITLWGVTAQNEPTDGNIPKFPFQAMGWTADLQRDFIVKDLGPALHDAGFADVKLMILDDQRILAPLWAEKILSDEDAAKFVSGTAVHWYLDWLTPSSELTEVHDKFPDKFILATEACAGELPWDIKPALGYWHRGEDYAHDIIQDLTHWVTGWTDWNIALDMKGGPNWVSNFVDSPIIVNADKGEFYKQPMFYALGHFSKFVVPGAKRISLETSNGLNLGPPLEYVAFLCPDSSIVIVIMNTDDSELLVSVHDRQFGYLNVAIPGHSIRTYIYWTS